MILFQISKNQFLSVEKFIGSLTFDHRAKSFPIQSICSWLS